MLIINQVFVSIIIVLITTLILEKSIDSIKKGIFISLISNSLSVLSLIFLFEEETLYGISHNFSFNVKYFFITFIIATIILFINYIFKKNFLLINLLKKRKFKDYILILLGIILGLLIGGLIFIPTWFNKTFGEIPADHFIFLLTQGNGESTKSQDLQILNSMVVPVFVIALLGGLLSFIKIGIRLDNIKRENVSNVSSNKKVLNIRKISFLFMILMLIFSIFYAFKTIPLRDIIKLQFEKSTYLEENYVFPTKENIKFPESKRNIIHIYMESIENSFYSKELGGYDENNIMPDLAKLSDTGISFSHTDKHGGPQQTYGSGHSIAAMVNMNAGVPMLAAGARNGSTLSYPDFITIGDILKENGYETSFMLGSDSNWGGLRNYFIKHGKFEIFDLLSAREKNLIPKNYKVWWGFEDDKLYEYAKDEMTRLASSDKPFYFILENADTHFPDGYVSENMKEKPFDKQYANVIHYSQKETVKLVEWIQSQDWYKDTTIIVTGDHRSMDKKFFEDWDGDYNRTIVNFFLNTSHQKTFSKEITNNRLFAPFDFFPTILSSIGVEIENERLGLGTNLFSGEKTLLEKDGFEKVEIELSKRSEFYDKHRENWD